jgi:alpha-glucan,water dikinase
VVIAEAYLAFLRAHGDRSAFHSTLQAGGVTRERLLSYERPIRSEPDFVPHLRDALLHDFGEFLGVLRAVHAATDLGTAIAAARPWLDGATQHLLDDIWRRHHDPGADTWLLQSVTHVRETVQAQLVPGRPGLRESLYLDLALEDFLRTVVERNLQHNLSLPDLRAWTELALRNLLLSRPSDELRLGLRHMQRLWGEQPEGQEPALHAQAVLERLRRALAGMVDGDFRLLQPVADHLGSAVGAADWSVRLFTEEVVRGRLEFVASALLRKLDTSLRASAGLGRWQVVSRGHGQASGVVERPVSLASVQGRIYALPTILIVDEIRGEEDIPQGVTAILGRSTVDLVSHLAVRARNAGVLLATCWDEGCLRDGGQHPDEWIRLRVTPAGEIAVEKGEPERESAPPAPSQRKLVARPAPGPWVLTAPGFRNDLVGAKTLNLQGLVGRLPEWIHLPASIALPFGVCERTWEDASNHAAREEQQALLAKIATASPEALPNLLASLRDLTTRLAPPPGFEAALRAAMAETGMPKPEPWLEMWRNITRVWASKWNDRAFFNRRANGIADDQLLMAVLIQEVVAAEYAFVIHTANPATGERDDLYAELVPGLGETLVGNHPGRALGFAMRRNESAPRILSFPSKSAGLYGQGLIFRSDSNGEDLAGFAGAGLYDSLMVPPASARPLDYTDDPLLWNQDLRRQILTGVARLGVMIEGTLGGPQDIEGVYAQGRFFVVQTRPQVGLDHG